jgi:precorrin-6A/cobalt-precorrin-6A reductase
LPENDGLEWVNDFAEAARRAAEYLKEREGRAFLTVGSNHLKEFCRRIPAQRLVVRVLPQSRVLRKCEIWGLSAESIAALQGPFGQALNRELFLHYQAAVVVTKDSGRTGGTEEKIAAAKEMGIPVIMVRRPLVSYPIIVRDINELLGLIME